MVKSKKNKEEKKEMTKENVKKSDNNVAGKDKKSSKNNSDINNEEEKITEIHEEEPAKSKEEELQEKLDELNDKYLRLFSEFDNFRKRTLKEKVEYSKMASADVITSLLPVYDDLARACESIEETQENEFIVKGINLIHTKFKSILHQKGVEEIPTIGESFNTDFHEAISNVAAKSEEEKGKIIDEVEKGYLLHGKVLRFAKVVVAN